MRRDHSILIIIACLVIAACSKPILSESMIYKVDQVIKISDFRLGENNINIPPSNYDGFLLYIAPYAIYDNGVGNFLTEKLGSKQTNRIINKYSDINIKDSFVLEIKSDEVIYEKVKPTFFPYNHDYLIVEFKRKQNILSIYKEISPKEMYGMSFKMGK